MSVIVLQVFVSLMLVVGSVVLFVWVIRSRTLEHSDRLALMPLEDDDSSTINPVSPKGSGVKS